MAATRDDFALQPSQNEQIQVRQSSQSVSVGTGRRQAPLPIPPKMASQPKVNATLLPKYAATPTLTSHSRQWTSTNPFGYETGPSTPFEETDQHSHFGQAAPVLPPRTTSPNPNLATNGQPKLPSRLSQGRPQLPPRQSQTSLLPTSNTTRAPPSLPPRSTQGPPPISSSSAEPTTPASDRPAPPLPSRPRDSITGLPVIPTPLHDAPPHSTAPTKIRSQTIETGAVPPPLPPRRGLGARLSPNSSQSQQGPPSLHSPSYESKPLPSIILRHFQSASTPVHLPPQHTPHSNESRKTPLSRAPPYAGGQSAPLPSQPPLNSQPASSINSQAPKLPPQQPAAIGYAPPVPNRQPQAQAPTEPSHKQQTSTTNESKASIFEQRVVELTNLERAKHGLPPLKWDSALGTVASEKSRDMSENNYFSHDSPTYGSLTALLTKFGITYLSAGENVALGQKTPEDAVICWMQSPGHRNNILMSNFTHIGVGYAAEGYYWTQQFLQKQEISSPNTAPMSVDDYEQKVVELTNQERAKYGLSSLKWDIELGKVAREKSRDMSEHNKMSHDSPVYGSMVDLMKRFGIKHRHICENIACGQQTPEEVVNSWMQSPGHRKNILTPNITHIGVGFELEGHYWTQEFIQKANTTGGFFCLQ